MRAKEIVLVENARIVVLVGVVVARQPLDNILGRFDVRDGTTDASELSQESAETIDVFVRVVERVVGDVDQFLFKIKRVENEKSIAEKRVGCGAGARTAYNVPREAGRELKEGVFEQHVGLEIVRIGFGRQGDATLDIAELRDGASDREKELGEVPVVFEAIEDGREFLRAFDEVFKPIARGRVVSKNVVGGPRAWCHYVAGNGLMRLPR